MLRCLGILILLGGLAGCSATPTDTDSQIAASQSAFGTGPLHEVLVDVPGLALPDIDCGTFIIHETSVSNRLHVTTYFNDAGDPVRIRVHVVFHGVLTNLSTGKTLRDNAEFTNTLDFAEGTVTQTGASFNLKVPHVGNVAGKGRIVFDLETFEILFEAGQHDDVGPGLTAICPLLA